MLQRKKEIHYSSHLEQYLHDYTRQQNLRGNIAHLGNYLPDNIKEILSVKEALHEGTPKLVNIIKLVYPSSKCDPSFKENNFSTKAIDSHRAAGYANAISVLNTKPWGNELESHIGAVIHAAPYL